MKPTDKQLKFIQDIESVLDIEFDGETKEDASEWISNYIDYFYEEVRRNEFEFSQIEKIRSNATGSSIHVLDVLFSKTQINEQNKE